MHKVPAKSTVVTDGPIISVILLDIFVAATALQNFAVLSPKYRLMTKDNKKKGSIHTRSSQISYPCELYFLTSYINSGNALGYFLLVILETEDKTLPEIRVASRPGKGKSCCEC